MDPWALSPGELLEVGGVGVHAGATQADLPWSPSGPSGKSVLCLLRLSYGGNLLCLNQVNVVSWSVEAYVHGSLVACDFQRLLWHWEGGKGTGQCLGRATAELLRVTRLLCDAGLKTKQNHCRRFSSYLFFFLIYWDIIYVFVFNLYVILNSFKFDQSASVHLGKETGKTSPVRQYRGCRHASPLHFLHHYSPHSSHHQSLLLRHHHPPLLHHYTG